MNIFFLHFNQELCAKYHNDKHCIKMILETTQLLYSCLWLTMNNEDWINNAPFNKSGKRGYRKTHANHPCAIWTRESYDNYKWLCKLGLELCKEYEKRYSKIHASKQHIIWLNEQCPPIPSIGMTEIKLAMPDKYKTSDPIMSYRDYYNNEKAIFSKWKINKPPHWFIPPCQ